MTKENSTAMLKRIRQSQIKAMENMSAEERTAYVQSKAAQSKSRSAALYKRELCKKELRNSSVLIRLTEGERHRLEKEAAKNHTTISALIRDRALGQQSSLDTLTLRLDKIESLLKR